LAGPKVRVPRWSDATTPSRVPPSGVAAPGDELHKGSPVFLALTAIGIVFGDIGTSPLYTFSVTLAATGHAPPTAADVLGIVSLIFWALMAMVSLKYVVLVLRADNDGEGGILALLSLVASERIANGPGIPILVLLGITGAALLYGDGVITPAISVLSAIEGLKLVAPGFEQFVLPLTLAILIGLFMVQRRGTATMGRLFGPVMVCWFVVIGYPSHPNTDAMAHPTVVAPKVPQANSRGDGCVGNCPAKCQASWQRLGFRSVEACYVKWGKLNRLGIARQCEAAIRARQPGEPGLPGC
jgi:hypothetical protein